MTIVVERIKEKTETRSRLRDGLRRIESATCGDVSVTSALSGPDYNYWASGKAKD
ncbi:unnamed protein product [Fusarium graminearum]|uniref:Chromosome 1, complete genome n=1 Tax=Gibberella zeae (strain ATCC MYA-4620 / CBS 123657 / FGSC 9075 / NRRL 31084 / PH-1) TaxID=229533 RepID=A0A098D393_GIBZE|nr:unnamed protein product [Fusarium graminearum]CZS76172.1 unnamed protein product [Fusarium graminearum]